MADYASLIRPTGYLVTRDGKKIGAGPVGKSDKIEAAIRRVAARMKVALPER